MVFTLSYQLYFCLLFAVGDPISTFMLRAMFLLLPKKFFGGAARPFNEVTGSMMFPYWQMFFNHMFNSKETYLGPAMRQGKEPLHKIDGNKCPIFFPYGANKPMMFHSDKWIKSIEEFSY